MTDPDVVVLRGSVHGMPASDLREAIERELPGRTVVRGETPAREREYVRRASVAVGIDLPTDLLSAAEDLSLFACVYAGTSHLDLEAFAERGVAVTSAAGVHGPNVAEHAIGSTIALARRFERARRQQDRREWRSFQTRELFDSTVTVVGMGHIGRAVVDRLEGFGATVLGVRYTPATGGPADEVFGFEDVHDPLARSDYVILACPLTDETEGLTDAEALRTMPPDAVLVNVARGPVVETEALVTALRENAVGAAALDVTDPEPLPADHPLWGFENVQITPHNAGHTPAYFERVAAILAENVHRLDAGSDDLENRVV